MYLTLEAKKVTRFLYLGSWMFFELSQEAGVQANYWGVNWRET